MRESDNITRQFDMPDRLKLQPMLLLLALLTSTIVLFPQNDRMYATIFASQKDCLGAYVVAMLVCGLVLSASIAAYSHKHPEWTGFGRGVNIAAALSYALSQTALLAGAFFPLPSLCYTAFGLVSGAAIIPVCLCWVRRYFIGLRAILFHGALICALSALLTWMLAQLTTSVAAPLVAVLGLIGVLVPVVGHHGAARAPAVSEAPTPAASSAKEAGGAPKSNDGSPKSTGGSPKEADSTPKEAGSTSKETSSTPKLNYGSPKEADSASKETGSLLKAMGSLLSIVWLPALGLIVFLLVSSTYSYQISSGISSEFIGSIIASMIVIFLCVARFKTPLAVLIERLIIPAIVSICIVLQSFPVGNPLFVMGAATVQTPLMFLSLYALALLVAVASTGEFPSPFVVGMTLAGACLSILLGTAYGNIVSALTDSPGQILWPIICLYFAVIVFSLGYSTWQHGNAAQSVDDPVTVPDPQVMDEYWEQRIGRIAAEKGLTKRETELFEYMSRGYGSSFIADALFISHNTARTHIRNIYRKLGVSSREELLQMIDETGKEPSE